MPIDVAGAKKLNNENVNTLWQDAINKELEILQLSFHLIVREDKSPVGYKKITGSLIFGMKMDLT